MLDLDRPIKAKHTGPAFYAEQARFALGIEELSGEAGHNDIGGFHWFLGFSVVGIAVLAVVLQLDLFFRTAIFLSLCGVICLTYVNSARQHGTLGWKALEGIGTAVSALLTVEVAWALTGSWIWRVVIALACMGLIGTIVQLDVQSRRTGRAEVAAKLREFIGVGFLGTAAIWLANDNAWLGWRLLVAALFLALPLMDELLIHDLAMRPLLVAAGVVTMLGLALGAGSLIWLSTASGLVIIWLGWYLLRSVVITAARRHLTFLLVLEYVAVFAVGTLLLRLKFH